MRERREIPKIEGGEAGAHFGGRDGGVDGDSLREYLPQEGIQSLVICNKGTETLGFT
jgi:hypothetical protein